MYSFGADFFYSLYLALSDVGKYVAGHTFLACSLFRSLLLFLAPLDGHANEFSFLNLIVESSMSF